MAQNRDAEGRVMGMMLTLQESRRSVKTFRTELVVPKTSQELGDDDVCLFPDRHGSHITLQDLDAVAPFERFPLLQTVTDMSVRTTSMQLLGLTSPLR